ncbi:uncharacterized protein BKA78DRAFT_322801 [Phyllosticta capitalensis]|uniref:uncharacterized protein n=1 Tax=Phyllosticta capitalensis TaxID=121624 RepID=UPI00312D604A
MAGCGWTASVLSLLRCSTKSRPPQLFRASTSFQGSSAESAGTVLDEFFGSRRKHLSNQQDGHLRPLTDSRVDTVGLADNPTSSLLARLCTSRHPLPSTTDDLKTCSVVCRGMLNMRRGSMNCQGESHIAQSLYAPRRIPLLRLLQVRLITGHHLRGADAN